MKLENAQIIEIPSEVATLRTPSATEMSQFLAWVSENDVFKTDVTGDEYKMDRGILYRFNINGMTDKIRCMGSGASFDRTHAAVIASAELVERFVLRSVFASGNIDANHTIHIESGATRIEQAKLPTALPSKGFHSSNGWAVHFCLKSAIENAVREAIERHILLYDYLRAGWSGFEPIDGSQSFGGKSIKSFVARSSFGGFSAALVAAASKKFQGNTFGYMCDQNETLLGDADTRLRAYIEAYLQIDDFEKFGPRSSPDRWLEKYQEHYICHSTTMNSSAQGVRRDHGAVSANILLLNLHEAFGLNHEFWAAFVFGGDLIPLFFKQKLSEVETEALSQVLHRWQLDCELPEVHPVL